MSRDTIFALASGSGPAGVAVIRISGPHASMALETLTRRPLPSARRFELRTIFDEKTNDRIDTALIGLFPGRASFTGEESAEIQCHGGRAVIAGILGALSRISGLRPAEAGEFTRRAVENGKIDLTQAEAIADLVFAETEAQRRQAHRQMAGSLAALYEDWRQRLIRAAAWVEASIDFADEEIPPEALEKSREALADIRAEIIAHLNDGRRGEILREGFHVAVIGPPNAGKSSLINALARREVAIVSAEAGTTRDVIEVRLDLKGFPVVLADTAGLRETDHAVEQEGVRRAKARAGDADFRLLVLDGSSAYPRFGLDQTIIDGADLTVWNKSDLGGGEGVRVSALTGAGLDGLIDRLAQSAASRLESESPALTRLRYRTALEEAISSLALSLQTREPELSAENIRQALRAVGRITGRVDLDELLDVVFRDFCIGK